ncbi:MAG TPA: hypothetical protein VIH09_02660 [Flavobacterium sp.]|uniref:hypothetical protein n=1 Tax=Flavobacterium sp. TaxID=239 RepID=UPI002F42C1E8
MKKIITIVAFGLFTLNAAAQEAKPVVQEKAKKESCCAAKASDEKTMTAAEVTKCQAKCKAEGKKCEATMAQNEGKKCDEKMATAEGKKCCLKKA